ncbi:MAG: thiamine phosphate synthase [Candidatus Altiarchaeota archaeon]|nr:thiamine phosphate synthase [Candidatus Altiarchaeota archaeon]
MNLHGFYFITDRKISTKGDVEAVIDALDGGASVVQYREKELTTNEMVETAKKIRAVTSGRAVFLVNDRVDVALASDADGVHVGQDDMTIEDARRILGKGKVIGVTVHDVDEAVEAEAAGADYVAASPIFPTSTKEDAGVPSGTALVQDIKDSVEVPVAAIGGISERNVDSVIKQ